MTREELLNIAKPILFNTEMVTVILEGRKTVTRRIIKKLPDGTNRIEQGDFGTYEAIFGRYNNGCFAEMYLVITPPYAAGDYLYVRETWCKGAIDCGEESNGRDVLYVSQCEGEDDYILKAHALHDNIGIEDVAWKPSIHMPKEAARIFLKVTDVRVERLQGMTKEDFKQEGIYNDGFLPTDRNVKMNPLAQGDWTERAYKDRFELIWNSTIKKQDLDNFGWEANPWVWVIEFERVGVEPC